MRLTVINDKTKVTTFDCEVKLSRKFDLSDHIKGKIELPHEELTQGELYNLYKLLQFYFENRV